jgi:hypothetical protein
MAFIGSIVGGFAAQQIGKYNADLYNQQAAYAKQQAVMREKVYENLDRPRLLKKQSSDYSNFFVSLLTSGVEFKGTAYEAALEFQVNQALDLSIADYNQKMDNIDSINQSLLLAAKAQGEIFKGKMTASTEYVKAGGSLLGELNKY